MHNRSWQEREHQRAHATGVKSEIAHWARTIGLYAPLALTPIIKDPEKRLRFITVASVSAAFLSTALSPRRSHEDYERERRSAENCVAAAAL